MPKDKRADPAKVARDKDAPAMGAGMAPVNAVPKADTRTQAERFEDAAREHRAGEGSERLEAITEH